MKPNRFASLLLLTSVMAASLSPIMAKAVGEGQWSPDRRVPGYLDDTFTPFLLADQHGLVHVFASQWVENGYRRRAVVYRQWTLTGGWTRPVDIILAPSGDAQILGAFINSSDIIHIIFMAGEAGSYAVYYSFAHVADADLAMAWSIPIMVGNGISLNSAVIIGDDQKNLFVLYSGNAIGNGVYFVASADSGESWSEPSPIYLTYDTALVPYSLRMVMGPDQQVRAIWNVVTSVGVDEMLYFANYDISESSWETPVELDSRREIRDFFGPSFPAITDNGTDILIVYNSGNPFRNRPVALGRPVQMVRMSSDNGKTWSNAYSPFAFHLGRSGEHAMVMDSVGASHCLFVQRIEPVDESGKYAAIGGLWHSTFKDGQWSNPDRFVTTYAPHDIRAVVSQGNILLAVWHEDPGLGEHGIWFSYRMLDAPAVPIVPLSTIPASTATGTVNTLLPPVDTPTSMPGTMLEDAPPSRWRSSPAFPILAGILPVLLVVAGTFLAYRLLNSRKT